MVKKDSEVLNLDAIENNSTTGCCSYTVVIVQLIALITKLGLLWYFLSRGYERNDPGNEVSTPKTYKTIYVCIIRSE